jgi:hypothetical protein
MVVITFASPALAVEFGVRGHYWVPGLDGDLKVDDDDLPGTTIDLTSDLGIDEESYPVIEAFVGLGKHHISASYFKVEYKGEKNLGKDINFAGNRYSFSERVSSELSYAMFDLEYRYDLLDLENILAGGSLGAVGKLKYLDVAVSLDSSSLAEEEETFKAPIPMIGAHLHVGLLADLLEFRAQLAGIGYSDAILYEGYADVSLTPFPFLDIHAGYRTFVLDVDVEDIELNFNTSGPFIGVSVGF